MYRAVLSNTEQIQETADESSVLLWTCKNISKLHVVAARQSLVPRSGSFAFLPRILPPLRSRSAESGLLFSQKLIAARLAVTFTLESCQNADCAVGMSRLDSLVPVLQSVVVWNRVVAWIASWGNRQGLQLRGHRHRADEALSSRGHIAGSTRPAAGRVNVGAPSDEGHEGEIVQGLGWRNQRMEQDV